MSEPLSLGFSPCPNDTFIFHALVHGLVPQAPRFAPPVLADVETLNLWALQHKLDVSKLSFHALGHALDHYELLAAGAALGRGCGPLLVARRRFTVDELADLRLAVPGRYTTAAMLLGLYAPACFAQGFADEQGFEPHPAAEPKEPDHRVQLAASDHGVLGMRVTDHGGHELSGHGVPQVAPSGTAKRASARESARSPQDGGPGDRLRLRVMRFDRIMPAIVRGEIEAGVIIHESRFTYQDHGLVMLADLGAWWEEISGLPIPLGGIVARRSLGSVRLAAINEAIRQSLLAARRNPAGALAYIRRHAGELDDQVLRSHIGLYVNDFSLALGDAGRRAVAEFLRRGREAGIIP